jgi:hypothetical protein
MKRTGPRQTMTVKVVLDEFGGHEPAADEWEADRCRKNVFSFNETEYVKFPRSRDSFQVKFGTVAVLCKSSS